MTQAIKHFYFHLHTCPAYFFIEYPLMIKDWGMGSNNQWMGVGLDNSKGRKWKEREICEVEKEEKK